MKTKIIPHGYFSRMQDQKEIKTLYKNYRVDHNYENLGIVVCTHKDFYLTGTTYIKDTSMPYYMMFFKIWRDFFRLFWGGLK